jgi:hypothetical protein
LQDLEVGSKSFNNLSKRLLNIQTFRGFSVLYI